jgi:vitamin B12 transporter
MNAALLVLAVVLQQPQDTVVLKPIVVTATRVPVAAGLVASAVTVLRGVDLRVQGIRTVADALRLAPGVSIVETGSYGGQTSLFVRGGESDYVKVLLDGVPLNDAGGGIDLAHFTTDNVDRIEIVRGPVSVLYGSDAVTGVVQIFTRAGGSGSPARFGAEAQAGTYGATQGAFDAVGAAGPLDYSARVSRFADDGLYAYNNQYRNSVANARLRFHPDARTDASLTYHYGDDIYHFPTNSQGQPADSNQRAAQRGPMLSLSAERTLSGRLDVRVSAAVRETRSFFNDEPDSPGEDGTFWSRDYVRRATTSALVTWRAGMHSLTGGIEYEDERQRGRSDFSASFGDFPDSIRVGRNNTAYFTQALLVAGRAAVTLGGRLDDNSQFGTHPTYRAGVVYRLNDGTRLRISAGTGFKEPTFYENFAHGFVLGNPNLDPERSRSWEAGIERRLRRGSASVTYFNQRFRDLIEYNPAPPPSQPNYFNVGAAVANGVEATDEMVVSTGVVFSLTYTYLHTKVLQSADSASIPVDPDGLFVPGKSLIRRPRHAVTPQLTASIGDRTHITLGAHWVGSRDDIDFNRPAGKRRVTLHPYTRADASAEYDLGHVVLAGRIENAFNDQSQEIAGFRPRGRTVMLGGRVTLGR